MGMKGSDRDEDVYLSVLKILDISKKFWDVSGHFGKLG